MKYGVETTQADGAIVVCSKWLGSQSVARVYQPKESKPNEATNESGKLE